MSFPFHASSESDKADSIKFKDMPLVLGSVIFLAVMFSVVNLVVDIIYAFVDPRIKSQYQKA